jgi:hypothetical protein
MACLIQFRTARFDVSRETPNDMNPIAGQSVLLWLRAELGKTNYHSTEPDQEDWGWYIDVKDAQSAYMVGASAEVEYKDDQGSELSYDVAPNAALDWTIQIHKQRTLKEKLLGRGKLAADDALCALVERILREAEAVENVTVERDP